MALGSNLYLQAFALRPHEPHKGPNLPSGIAASSTTAVRRRNGDDQAPMNEDGPSADCPRKRGLAPEASFILLIEDQPQKGASSDAGHQTSAPRSPLQAARMTVILPACEPPPCALISIRS